jgi:DNA-binding XRE family transcriptional regulator
MIDINRIEKERKRRKLSKYKMSELLGMSRQAYYDICVNKSTKINTLDKIANVLGLKSKDLIL